MRSEDEIREELHYQIQQGFLDPFLNVTTNPERIAFVNGIIYALKYVLEDTDER